MRPERLIGVTASGPSERVRDSTDAHMADVPLNTRIVPRMAMMTAIALRTAGHFLPTVNGDQNTRESSCEPVL